MRVEHVLDSRVAAASSQAVGGGFLIKDHVEHNSNVILLQYVFQGSMNLTIRYDEALPEITARSSLEQQSMAFHQKFATLFLIKDSASLGVAKAALGNLLGGVRYQDATSAYSA